MRLKPNKALCVVLRGLMLWLVCAPALSQGKDLIVAVDHYPPWTISESKTPGGINIEILREISRHLDLKLVFYECPWKRCLHVMRTGQADIISSLLKRPDREAYMLYIEPPYKKKSNKAFYLRLNEERTIRNYEDLYGLRIGVVRGYRYFLRFDQDTGIQRDAVTSEIQLLKMLANNRIDAFVGTESQADYLIYSEGFQGKFRKSAFKYDKEVPVYMAISKKSEYAAQLPRFNTVVQQLVAEGVVDRIIQDFFKNLREKSGR